MVLHDLQIGGRAERGGGDVSVAGSYRDVGTATPIRMATLLRTFVFG
jgi:hypothetical protein